MKTFRKKWLGAAFSVMALLTILAVPQLAESYKPNIGVDDITKFGNWKGFYGHVNVCYAWENPAQGIKNSCWAYNAILIDPKDGKSNVADLAWAWAYRGMGLDSPVIGGKADNMVPTVTFYYDDTSMLAEAGGWALGNDIFINTWKLKDPGGPNTTLLGGDSWWNGKALTHEISHFFFGKVTAPLFGGGDARVEDNRWYNFLTESVAFYCGAFVWPYMPESWNNFAKNTLSNDWGFKDGANSAKLGDQGWNQDSIQYWNKVAMDYNFNDAHSGFPPAQEMDHLYGFGFFLCNFADYSKKLGVNNGQAGSAGYSIFAPYGYGGSYNLAIVLNELRKGAEYADAIKAVYGYNPELNGGWWVNQNGPDENDNFWYTEGFLRTQMSFAIGDDTLDSKYYWYWYEQAKYARNNM